MPTIKRHFFYSKLKLFAHIINVMFMAIASRLKCLLNVIKDRDRFRRLGKQIKDIFDIN